MTDKDLSINSMKKAILILVIVTIFSGASAIGQNLFFIKESSYLSTEPMNLKANSEDGRNLDVFIAKNQNLNLFVITQESPAGGMFEGVLIIYLEDGSVITLKDDNNFSDYVDEKATSAYKLSDSDMNKLMESNIHTVRFSISGNRGWAFDDGDWSVSNNGIPTKTIISEFYK